MWHFWKRQRTDEMRGHHGDGQSAATVAGSGFLGWSMVHRAARPVAGRPVGDPHWPVHVALANMTRGADGRWLTVAGRWSTVAADERDLMRPAPAVDKLTQALVRNALYRRYGVSFARNACTGLRRGAGPGAAGVRQTRRVDRGAAHRPGVRRRGGGRGARTGISRAPLRRRDVAHALRCDPQGGEAGCPDAAGRVSRGRPRCGSAATNDAVAAGRGHGVETGYRRNEAALGRCRGERVAHHGADHERPTK